MAQDPEPPIEDRWEVDLAVGALPFNPGQTFSYAVPTSIPDTASQVLVVATFTCSLIQGQIQGGMLIQWTIWSPILLGNGTPSTASFQQLLWCAPGQLTTVQSIQWLPITAASRVLFGQARHDRQHPVGQDPEHGEDRLVPVALRAPISVARGRCRDAYLSPMCQSGRRQRRPTWQRGLSRVGAMPASVVWRGMQWLIDAT